MYIRDEVRERWASEGVLDRKNSKINDFMKYIQDHPSECWDEYIAVFRRDYYDLFDKIVPPLLKSRDFVLRAALVAKADLDKPKEVEALKAMIHHADPEVDQPVLLAIARRGHKGLMAELEKHEKLTPETRAQLHPPEEFRRPVMNLRAEPARPATKAKAPKPRTR